MKKILFITGTILLTTFAYAENNEIVRNSGNTSITDNALADQMEVEEWMGDYSGWLYSEMMIEEVDFEISLELEAWMTDLNQGNWTVEEENLPELEIWMVEISDWAAGESEEELEAWMTDPSGWLK